LVRESVKTIRKVDWGRQTARLPDHWLSKKKAQGTVAFQADVPQMADYLHDYGRTRRVIFPYGCMRGMICTIVAFVGSVIVVEHFS
jgi:hypothetical protein